MNPRPFILTSLVVMAVSCTPSSPPSDTVADGTVIRGIVLDGRYESEIPSVGFLDPDSIEPNGDPIEGVEILLRTHEPAIELSALTGPDGRFALGPVELASNLEDNAFWIHTEGYHGVGIVGIQAEKLETGLVVYLPPYECVRPED